MQFARITSEKPRDSFSLDRSLRTFDAISVADDAATTLGTDKFGNTWSAVTRADGTQVWTQTRNGKIINGGVNNTPHSFNPETGLSRQQPPRYLLSRGTRSRDTPMSQPNTTSAESPLMALRSAISHFRFAWSQCQSPCASASVHSSTMAFIEAHFGAIASSGSCGSTK